VFRSLKVVVKDDLHDLCNYCLQVDPDSHRDFGTI